VSQCIIQDDKSDWEVQASKMAQIFSNAQLTISATRSANGAGGCFSTRSNEPFKFTHQDQILQLHDQSLWQPYQISAKDRDGFEKDFFLRLKPPHDITESPLLQRAWVFQEQILSPRIVHFAVGELYWECKTYVSCECTGWEKRSETLQLATRRRKAHTQLVGRTPSLRNFLSSSSEKEKRRDTEAYYALVEQYSAMHITKDLDYLPALSGVTFGRQDQYLAGMWRNILLESLPWVPKRSSTHKMTYRPFTYRAPTWSWASVQGPIQYLSELSRYGRESNEDSQYNLATVLSVACTPEGRDPRGKVVDGYLKIEGQVTSATIDGFGVRDEAGNGESDTYAYICRGKLKSQCSLDIPLALVRTAPAEVKFDEKVVILRISEFAALVLSGIEDAPGAYRRVGIFKVEEERGKEWFLRAAKTAVFIL
jgi:Heterokaryon incompatibility protein (HET)